MVVLAPNRPIGPADIPPEVRNGSRSLLPVPLPRVRRGSRGRGPMRTQLEFIFRTLVEMRVDMDDLRREFEAYRDEVGAPAIPGPAAREIRIPAPDEVLAPGGNGFTHAVEEPGWWSTGRG
jgi:hypothetical protein